MLNNQPLMFFFNFWEDFSHVFGKISTLIVTGPTPVIMIWTIFESGLPEDGYAVLILNYCSLFSQWKDYQYNIQRNIEPFHTIFRPSGHMIFFKEHRKTFLCSFPCKNNIHPLPHCGPSLLPGIMIWIKKLKKKTLPGGDSTKVSINESIFSAHSLWRCANFRNC